MNTTKLSFTQQVALWDYVITQKLDLARLDHYLVHFIGKARWLLSECMVKMSVKALTRGMIRIKVDS